MGYGKPAGSGFWGIIRESDLIKYYLTNQLFRRTLFPVSNVGGLEKYGQDFFFTFDEEDS